MKQSGFTFIELMVVLALVAILGAISAPNLSKMMTGSKVSAAHNKLVSALKYSRSSAVTQGRWITLCSSAQDGKQCGSGWNYGWIIFNDLNKNGTIESGESILELDVSVKADSTFKLVSSHSFVYFDAQGRLGLSGGTSRFTMALCDRQNTFISGIVVLQSGQVRRANDNELSSC